jgi:hypothetical protein
MTSGTIPAGWCTSGSALADFRRHTTPQGRHDLALEFAGYEAAQAAGVCGAGKDPARYVKRKAT